MSSAYTNFFESATGKSLILTLKSIGIVLHPEKDHCYEFTLTLNFLFVNILSKKFIKYNLIKSVY